MIIGKGQERLVLGPLLGHDTYAEAGREEPDVVEFPIP